MIHSKAILSATLVACMSLTGFTAVAEGRIPASPRQISETVVVYPWNFQSGNKAAVQLAIGYLSEIAAKSGSKIVPTNTARSAWKSGNFAPRVFGQIPPIETLQAFAKSVNASEVIYGDIAWNTTKISESPTPYSSSVVTVDAYVFDAASGKIIYSKKSVKGMSNEESSDLSFLSAIYTEPIVAKSEKGHRTPDQQRAVQIALGRAFESWIKDGAHKQER